jgi:ABC-type Fe3+ transport system permease subunit
MELKPVPAIVTTVPTWPDAGVREVMFGEDGITVNGSGLLAAPPTVTTMLPVVAPGGTAATIVVLLQLETVNAPTPLNVTALNPCEDPRFVPEIVTSVLMGPLAGLIEVMLGAAGATVIVQVADFVGSTTDVAVTVTVGGLGTEEGAI